MLEKLSQEKLVATVVGWDCCCDIDLSLTKGGWLGSGFSKKDRGLRVELHLSKTNESLKLAVYLQSEKKFFEAVVPGFQTGGVIGFCIDANGFFGSPQEKDGTDRNLVRILLGGHQALKGQFRNYAFGLSYMPVILDLFEKKHPKRILEWGPGRSSIFFAELFPKASIAGVEHNSNWHERCQEVANVFPQFSSHFRHVKLAPAQSQGYVSFPLFQEGKYDVIFVDGRLRCDCVAIASLVLARGGVVLLHDAHRKVYHPAFELFEEQRTVCNTAILEKPIKRLS